MLAAQGAAVAVNDVVKERAEETVAAIEAAGGRAVSAPFDVTSYDAAVGGIADVTRDLGPVDILVNNAGNGGTTVMRLEPFREMDPESWDGPIRVNLYGVLHCSRAVINGMCDRGWGRVITISSAAATQGGTSVSRPTALGRERGSLSCDRSRSRSPDQASPRTRSARPDGHARPHGDGRSGRRHPGRAHRHTGGRRRRLRVARVGPRASWVTAQTIEINGGLVTT